MAYSGKLYTALSLLLLVALTGVSSRHVVADPRLTIIEAEERQFLPGGPKERLRGPGGRVEVWSEDFKELKDADIGAAIITLEPQSLALPMYTDAPSVKFVLEGEGRAGLISPIGIRTNLRRVRRGDALAVPRGWAVWVWNNADKPLRMMGVADTSHGPTPSRYTSFHLMGAQKEMSGGLLHGFSKDLLARAWNVDEKDVDRLLAGQKDTAFVKVQPGEVDLMENALDAMEEEARLSAGVSDPASANMLGWEVTYNLYERGADIVSKRGGCLTAVSGWKLPIFKKIRFSVVRVQLEGNAILAPHWVANGAAVHYVTSGKGRVEITYPDGRQALRHDAKQGDVIVIPAGFAHATVADNEGLEFISFINRGKPQFGFLAGANSIYMNLPRTILRTAFNVDAQLIDKLRQTRLFDYVILPPPATQEDGGVEQSEQITNSWQAAMMGENNLASLFSEEENLDFDE